MNLWRRWKLFSFVSRSCPIPRVYVYVCVHVHVCVWSFISPHLHFGFFLVLSEEAVNYDITRVFFYLYLDRVFGSLLVCENFFFFEKKGREGIFFFPNSFRFCPSHPPPPFLLSKLMIYMSSRFNVQHGIYPYIYIYTLFTPR